MDRIIIMGYMGSGKTTLEKALSKDSDMPFYDLDRYIESRMRRTIKQLFEERDEEGFRQIEYRMLHKVAEFEHVTLNCGGGTPCFFDNIDYMNRQGETVFLKASPEVLYDHLKMGRTVRPLLLGRTPEEVKTFIGTQLKEHESFYTQAKHTLDVSLMDSYDKIQATADQLKVLLNLQKTAP